MLAMTVDQVRAILHGAEPFTLRPLSGREDRVEHFRLRGGQLFHWQ